MAARSKGPLHAIIVLVAIILCAGSFSLCVGIVKAEIYFHITGRRLTPWDAFWVRLQQDTPATGTQIIPFTQPSRPLVIPTSKYPMYDPEPTPRPTVPSSAPEDR